MKVVSLWSGGKDSCFACYKAIEEGYNIVSLFNFTDSSGKRSLSHGISSSIIKEQMLSTGISFFQKAMRRETYRKEFIKLINEWKKKRDIKGIVFGDIYLQEHKDWIDEVCKELEVKAIMPLWGKDTGDLLEEFIKEGFKAIVVATKEEFKDLLGREVNNKLMEELKRRKIDFCGEEGEFHTFVYDGPLFKEPLKVVKGDEFSKEGHSFLNLSIFEQNEIPLNPLEEELEERGITMEKLVETGLEMYIPDPKIGNREKVASLLRKELKKTLKDINISSLILAGLKLEEEGEKGAIPHLTKEEYEKDPPYLIADEILGIQIAKYIGGTRALFEFERFDRKKPGILKKLPPFLDDVIGGLITGCLVKICSI